MHLYKRKFSLFFRLSEDFSFNRFDWKNLDGEGGKLIRNEMKAFCAAGKIEIAFLSVDSVVEKKISIFLSG